MAMNRGQIRTYVLQYLGKRSDVTTALADDFINQSYLELAASFFFKLLEQVDVGTTTVASTSSYSLPTKNLYVDSITDLTNKRKLEAKDMEWYQDQDHEEDGQPLYWVHSVDEIILQPIPDGVYDLRIVGRKLPTVITSDATIPDLPENWHLILALHAAADLAFMFGMDERGMMLKNEMLGKISAAMEVRTFERMRQYGQITVQKTK